MTMQYLHILRRVEDEEFMSFITRTAKANGLDLPTFFSLYVRTWRIYDSCYKPVYPLYEIMRVMKVTDPLTLFLGSTTVPFQTVGVPESVQAGTATPLLMRMNDPLLALTISRKADKYKLCPECMNADLKKYGFIYYHRSHQLKSVHVCHKHGSILYQADINEIDPFDIEKLTPCVDTVQDTDLQYARFVYDTGILLSGEKRGFLPYDNFRKCVNTLIPADTVSLNNKKKAEFLASLLWKNGLGRILEPNQDSLELSIKTILRTYGSKIDTRLMLLHAALLRSGKTLNDYLVSSPLSPVTCPACGCRYPTSPTLQKLGIGCPCQHNMPLSEYLSGLFNNQGIFPDYAFQALDDGENMIITYLPSGNSYQRVPRHFLFHSSKVQEQRILSVDQINDLIRTSSNGMISLYTLDRQLGTYTVKCSRCGTLRTYRGTCYSHIRKCKICLNKGRT